MTTGTERVAAAATGGSSDRIPVFCNLLDRGPRELGMSPREYYASGEHVAGHDFADDAEETGRVLGLPLRWRDASLDDLESVRSGTIARRLEGTPCPS